VSSFYIFKLLGPVLFEGIFVGRSFFVSSHLHDLGVLLPPPLRDSDCARGACIRARQLSGGHRPLPGYAAYEPPQRLCGDRREAPRDDWPPRLISGAAHGNNLPNIAQAFDSSVGNDEKKLARMIRETLAKAKDKPGLRCPGQLPSIIPRYPSEVRRQRSGTLGGL